MKRYIFMKAETFSDSKGSLRTNGLNSKGKDSRKLIKEDNV